MAVDTFDPQQFDPSSAQSLIDEGLVARAVACALAQSEVAAELSLTAEDVEALAPLAVHGGGLMRASNSPQKTLSP